MQPEPSRSPNEPAAGQDAADRRVESTKGGPAVETIVRFAPKARENVAQPQQAKPVREIGGRKDGPEPTRYGDWEFKGRCIDF